MLDADNASCAHEPGGCPHLVVVPLLEALHLARLLQLGLGVLLGVLHPARWCVGCLVGLHVCARATACCVGICVVWRVAVAAPFLTIHRLGAATAPRASGAPLATPKQRSRCLGARRELSGCFSCPMDGDSELESCSGTSRALAGKVLFAPLTAKHAALSATQLLCYTSLKQRGASHIVSSSRCCLCLLQACSTRSARCRDLQV